MVDIKLASVTDIKNLVEDNQVSRIDALVRCDAVLARNVLSEGKRRRWTRLREWLVKSIEEQQETANS